MHCWCVYTGTATMENSMEVPQKIRNRPTIGPINPTTGYICVGNEIIISKRLYPHVHCNIIYDIQDMEII